VYDLRFGCSMWRNVRVNVLRVNVLWGGDLSSRVRAPDFVGSIHNIAVVRSNPVAGDIYYLLFAANVRCQWFVCVLSSPWWSRPSRTLFIHCILKLV